jgi:hypothetical protein
LQLSHDETTLYVNDTGGINIYAFDVQADGRLANSHAFASYYRRRGRKPAAGLCSCGAVGLVDETAPTAIDDQRTFLHLSKFRHCQHIARSRQ